MKRTWINGLMVMLLVVAGHAAANVTLSVDAGADSFRPINDQIYGVNIANWAADHYARMCAPMLTNAGVTVIRYGATNIERYNWRNNRLYNVISLENQFVPMSWRTFVRWCIEEMNAKPFIQVPAFGRVASDLGDPDYNYDQPISEIAAWVEEAGTNVPIWGVGNEPFIAWKLVEYEGDGYSYNDGAHGDQIYLEDLDPEVFYPRWVEIGAAIRGANPEAKILGPTPANWYLYWGTDFSTFCPASRANPGGHVDDPGWHAMANGNNQFDGRVFPGRGGNPSVAGWEKNEQTGVFNDKRTMNMFVKSVAEYAATHGGTQVCDYLDFHRYMNTDNERAAVQELRDLWEVGFQSSDQETGYASSPMILRRFQNILDHYYPDQMGLSLSEYDYFYWRGHPDDPQISAIGEVDYLGIFARFGVQLACNWYIGEPDQSGGGYHHAADSAKQAMFNEHGEPNPKYWAFKLMSLNFRDQALTQVMASDNELFSLYGGVDTNANELTVVSLYKGVYHSGGLIEGQGTTNATMVISNFNITGVKRVLRYGHYDPEIMTMEPGGISVQSVGDHQEFSYEYEPLSIYLMQFYGEPTPPAEEAPESYLHITPSAMHFGAFETGVEVLEEEDHATHIVTYTTNYKSCIKITNVRNSNTAWSVNEDCPWLSFLTETSGVTKVTDRVFLEVDRTGFGVGVYSTDVTVATSEGTVAFPVTMEVVPREAGGEARICDFDTGSLAHTWAIEEPYAIGFYDQHGQPADMEYPYIYNMSLDYEDVSAYGGLASMRVDFDRANGDNEGGKLYTAFGTYGHTAGDETCPTTMWVPPGEPLSNYIFKFDVKTETEGFGETVTKLLVTMADTNGNVAKPSTGISDFKETLTLEDGFWQTVSTPLDSLFYDWTWPGGQTGDVINLDFSAISQLSFVPWNGRDDKRGTIWLDNFRIESRTAGGESYPATVISQKVFEVYESETVQLDARASYDRDGTITGFLWTPSTGLSNPTIGNPVFTPPGPGMYVFDVAIMDSDGLTGRDVGQVVIYVQENLQPSEVKLYRDVAMTEPVSGSVISNCFDLYVRYVCLSGGSADRIDTTRAVFKSDDLYGDDGYNDADPIEVTLRETTEDSRIFTGQFRLGAFSDEERAELGVQVGSHVIFSNLFYQEEWEVGSQDFGLETVINHIEEGIGGFNCFDGVWYSYDDLGEGCASTVLLTNHAEGATPYSSECAYLYSVLGQGVSTNPDVIFAGAGNKLTPYEAETPFVACIDVSSTTGYEGVSFRLKGNGTRVTVVLKSLAVTNYDDYAYTIEHTPTNEWRQFIIPFSRFEQEGWGRQAIARDAALRQLNAVQFKFSSHLDGQTNHLYIDDIALFGGQIYGLSHPVYHKLNSTTMDGFDGGLLVNPGFVSGDGGWTLIGNANYEDWSGWRLVMENWDGYSGAAEQSIAVEDDKAYQFSVQAWKNSGYNGHAYMELYWYDADDNLLRLDSEELTDDLVLDTPQTFSFPWHWAPVNAATVTIHLESSSGSSPVTDNCIQFDNAAFYEYGRNADDAWISGWIPGSVHSFTNDCAEGSGALVLSSTNTGYLGGMFVAPYEGGVTRTNYSLFDGFIFKARRANDYNATGDGQARIRVAVCTNEDPVARTRWYPVDASEWEDYIVLPKEKFLTALTVDNPDPAAWETWSNDWSAITRIIIEYGTTVEGQKPYDLFVDDFRPYYNAEYGPDTITNPPIVNYETPDLETVIYNDAGSLDGTQFEAWYPSFGYGYHYRTNSISDSYILMSAHVDWSENTSEAGIPEGSSCLALATSNDHLMAGFWVGHECAAVTNLDIDEFKFINVQSNIVYLGDDFGKYTYRYDFSDPLNPVALGSIQCPDWDGCLICATIDGSKYYTVGDKLTEYDLSDPAHPVTGAVYDLPITSCMDIEADSDMVYGINRWYNRDLTVYDLTVPGTVTPRGTLALPYSDRADLVLNGSYAYLTLGSDGLFVIDISDPDAPSIVTSFTNRPGVAMLRYGNYLYQIDHNERFSQMDNSKLRVWDISSPAAPLLVTDCAVRFGWMANVYDMHVKDDQLYLSGDQRLRVVDVSTPSAPVMSDYSGSFKYRSKNTALVGDYMIGVADADRTPMLFDVSSSGNNSTNLSAYADGFIKFWIKTPVDVDVRVRAGGVERSVRLSACNWAGLDQWQEILVPMRKFGFEDAELEQVYQPFAVGRPNVSDSLQKNIYIDNIRYRTRP